jgi:MFS family permease
VSRWAPPEEKGKFIGALLGGTLGTMVTWPLLGFIIESLGWSWSFFINGGIVLVWCVFWILLVADSPEAHSTISEEEKLYITKSLGDTIKRTKVPTRAKKEPNNQLQIAGTPPVQRHFPFGAILGSDPAPLWKLVGAVLFDDSRPQLPLDSFGFQPRSHWNPCCASLFSPTDLRFYLWTDRGLHQEKKHRVHDRGQERIHPLL